MSSYRRRCGSLQVRPRTATRGDGDRKVFKSILHYSGRDPDPSVPIDEIRPLSRRAHVLMLRNRTKPLLAERFLNIAGAIEMSTEQKQFQLVYEESRSCPRVVSLSELIMAIRSRAEKSANKWVKVARTARTTRKGDAPLIAAYP
jgi:hypothetical protein